MVPRYRRRIGVLPSLYLKRLSSSTTSGLGYRAIGPSGSYLSMKLRAKALGAIAVTAASPVTDARKPRRPVVDTGGRASGSAAGRDTSTRSISRTRSIADQLLPLRGATGRPVAPQDVGSAPAGRLVRLQERPDVLDDLA